MRTARSNGRSTNRREPLIFVCDWVGQVPCVLVIDDDAGTLVGYESVRRAAAYDDKRVPELTGLEVVRRIRASCPQTAIILVSAWATPELLAEATRHGATLFANTLPIGDQVATVVRYAWQLPADYPSVTERDPVGYAARRWADLVVRGAQLTEDVKTVVGWCRGVGLARSTLKNWCRAVGVTPKTSLAFMRLLHVVVHHAGESWNLQARLDIVDRRTADALITRAGVPPDSVVPEADSFILRQRLIASLELLDAVRERLLGVPHR